MSSHAFSRVPRPARGRCGRAHGPDRAARCEQRERRGSKVEELHLSKRHIEARKMMILEVLTGSLLAILFLKDVEIAFLRL